MRRIVALACCGVTISAIALVAWLRPRIHDATEAPVSLGRMISSKQVEGLLGCLPGPRSPGDAAALAKAEAWAFDELKALGYTAYREPILHAAGSVHRHGPTHNVLTAVPAEGRFWIVAAHLDTVPGSPGADDDGSGVAVALEVARSLAETPAADRVVFALFNEEETGLLGSRQFVANLPAGHRARIEGVIVLDAVGYFDDRTGAQTAPFPLGLLLPGEGDFLSAITLGESGELADRFVAARDHAAPMLRVASFRPPRAIAGALPDLWRSDHAPFWEAGVPALFLTDTANFRSARYHRPDDTVDSIDPVRMAHLAAALAQLVCGR